MIIKWLLTPPYEPIDKWGSPIIPRNPIRRWWHNHRYSWSHKLGRYLYQKHPNYLFNLGYMGHSIALSCILADELTKDINEQIIQNIKTTQ